MMLLKQSSRVRKEEIVQAAVDVIGKHGVQSLTIAAIADTAGMSKTNFYRHFDGKEEIFFAIAEYIGAAITDKAAAIATGSRKSLEKLEAMTCVCSVGLDMIAIPGSVDAGTIAAIIADEMAIGMINGKTTAVRLIPVPGKEAGDFVSFGGLFGESAIALKFTVRSLSNGAY